MAIVIVIVIRDVMVVSWLEGGDEDRLEKERAASRHLHVTFMKYCVGLLYTFDAADELLLLVFCGRCCIRNRMRVVSGLGDIRIEMLVSVGR